MLRSIVRISTGSSLCSNSGIDLKSIIATQTIGITPLLLLDDPRPLARSLLIRSVGCLLVLREPHPVEVLVAERLLGAGLRPLAGDVGGDGHAPNGLARLGVLGQRRIGHLLDDLEGFTCGFRPVLADDLIDVGGHGCR